MKSPAGTLEGSGRKVLTLQKRRMRQILNAILAAFFLACILSLVKGNYVNTALEAAASALIVYAFFLNERGHLSRATGLLVSTLMLVLCALMVMDEGLFDESVIAFPGLLVFASMFGSRRMFVALLSLTLACFSALYGANRLGWLHNTPAALELGRPVLLSAVLSVTAFFVWLLSSDLRRALVQLEEEKGALIDSHARVELLAHRDTLTNLPNRTLAKDRLHQLLLLAQRKQTQAAVMFLDLDNFKTVNDSLGHAAGDELLCLVAARLEACLRASDTVARLGGDEFLLLMGDMPDDEAITAAATKVMQQLAQPFGVGGMEVVATASLGIAVFPRDGADMDDLLKNADLAMYRAKDAGRNAFRFFDAAMNESVVEHLHLASGLRNAMSNGELRVYYQPQFQLDSGAIVGAEALLRWKHPSLGFIPPNKFIPVAERTGLINEVGAWVLNTACRDAQAWRARGLGDVIVSVNVSPIQFRRDDIEREVGNALAQCDLPAAALELELTESLLVADAQHVSEVLHRLGALGVKFAIDDFGTGYSNLGYLQRFPVQRLKVDQSFVRQMTSSTNDAGIVRAVIEMAHCLHLEVVAEGVEGADTLESLRAYGCEFGQGFYWSPALPADEFERFARAQPRAPL